jgi:cysteine desulfurase family protein (TIGR01976 family)
MPPTPLDPELVRTSFPALSRRFDAGPAIFFDNAAGTQVPVQVIAQLGRYLIQENANAGGVFATSRATDERIRAARAACADFLGAAGSDQIVFGANMTTLTFHLARALARELEPGDEILTTRLEHDANVAPWLMLAERGVTVRFADIHPQDATLDLASLEAQLGPRTRLVAIGYASNTFGTLNPVAEVVGLARRAGALSFVDAVHYAPHGPIDVAALGCDFLVCSAYKFFGPHLGVLYGRGELLERLRPDKVRPASDRVPERFETGTQNHEGLAGLLGTFEYLEGLAPAGADAANRGQRLRRALQRIAAAERELGERFIAGASAISGLTIYGLSDPRSLDRRVPTFAIRLRGWTPQALAEALAARGIFVWHGHNYALEPVRRLGLLESGGVVRISPVHYNTAEEIDQLLAELRRMSRAAG